MIRKILATICLTALLATTALAAENPFTDVASTSDLAQPVVWAVEEGITSGTSATTFSPESTCTRGQVVTFLWRAKGEPTPTTSENPFTDLTEDWYYTAVLWAVEEGITTGTSDTTFSPENTCTDEQVVTFLYRAMGEPEPTTASSFADGAPDYAVDAISWADETGLLAGLDFTPGSFAPRSDVVTYLYRDAGSPEITIDVVEEPVVEETVVETTPTTYTYIMPTVEKPSAQYELTYEYFTQIFEYLLFSGEEKFSFTCTGYTYDQMCNQMGLTDVMFQGYDYALGRHIDILALYDGYGWAYTNGNNTTISIYLRSDTMTLAQVEGVRDTFYDQVSTLVTSFFDAGYLNESDSDATKALYFYQWCCLNLHYDTTFADSSYNGYGTLTNGTGVCQGYAALFNAMCHTAGIEAYGVGGSVKGEGHTWSYVNLDGTWYYVDATFGDPIPDTQGYCNEAYFGLTKEEITQTHVLDTKWN